MQSWIAESEFIGFWLEEEEENRVIETFSNIGPTLIGRPHEETEEKLPRFLPRFNSTIDIMFQPPKSDANLVTRERRFGQNMSGRSLFRTENGKFLVCGTKSPQDGDFAAVLAGGGVPYSIRAVGDPEKGEEAFQFVGEAYVHRIMHGDAIKMVALNDIREIILV